MYRIHAWAIALWLTFAPAIAFAQVPGVVNVPGPATGTGYPVGSDAFLGAAVGTTTATVTIGSRQGKTIYVCTVYMAEVAGTAAAAAGTVTGLQGSPSVQTLPPTSTAFSVVYDGTLAAGFNAKIFVTFNPCMPALQQNFSVQAIAPVATAATLTVVNVHGYYF